jgi:hypothetical protein
MGILNIRYDPYDPRMGELQIIDTSLVLLDIVAADSRVATGGGFWRDALTTDFQG